MNNERSCEFCSFYLYKEWPQTEFCKPHRANYCAHPAYIESYSMEQSTGQTESGEAKMESRCILDDGETVADLIADVRGNRLHYETHDLRGPTLSRMSYLQNHTAPGEVFDLPGDKQNNKRGVQS